MKFLITLTFALMTSLSFAGEKYICIEKGGDEYAPHKMILTQVGDAEIHEGKFYPFYMEIYQSDVRRPVFATTVNVRTEDVMFRFTNTAKKVSGIIFLDEFDQAHVKIGKKEIRLNCN